MAARWQPDGALAAEADPYIHWWGETRTSRSGGIFDKIDLPRVPSAPNAGIGGARVLRRGGPALPEASAMPETDPSQALRLARTLRARLMGTDVPVLAVSKNPHEISDWSLEKAASGMPALARDTVITGIIDTGISLGSDRFRLPDGRTRVLAAWQQEARFAGQPELPVGEEIHAGRIDALMRAHGGGTLEGWLDEEAFNRAAGLVAPLSVAGQRDLDHPAAHGTHVLDLAAGLDPAGADPEAAERSRIIAVNLPAQHAHGNDGAFLSYFALFGMMRILHLAKAAWIAQGFEGPMGFPVVINFSYGMQAGPKDGGRDFERLMEDMLAERRADEDWSAPIRLVMPAGNDNLSRGAASMVMGTKDEAHPTTGLAALQAFALPWRIQPDDGTSNFAEIWVERFAAERAGEVIGALRLFVTPPGEDGPLPVEGIADGAILTLGGRARVYCQVVRPEGGSGARLRILVAVAPTAASEMSAILAPAGLWRIDIAYDGPPRDVSVFVQSDQSGTRHAMTARRSYLDQAAYVTHGPDGAEADTFSYDPWGRRADHDLWRSDRQVQRKGTHNALATWTRDELVCVAGHVDATGAPARYSATTDGLYFRPGARGAPSASLPSEDAPNHFGVLAAGARCGSVVNFRGTSMATAMATRHIAGALRGWFEGGAADLGGEEWLRALARDRESARRPAHWHGLHRRDAWKLGAGRLPAPPAPGRVDRLGER